MALESNGELQWPVYNELYNRDPKNKIVPLFNIKFIGYLLLILLISSTYLVFLNYAPTLVSLGIVSEVNFDFWWPVELVLNIGSGGFIDSAGFMSVGLLGGFLRLKNTHNQIKRGVLIRNVVFSALNIPLTVLVTIGVVSLYFLKIQNIGLLILVSFFMVMLAGSFIVQLLNAYLYKKTGMSLLIFNFIFTLIFLINELGFSPNQEIVLWLIISVLVLSTVYLKNRPIPIKIEIGELPRITTTDFFPAIDFKWFNAISLFMLAISIIGYSLWEVAEIDLVYSLSLFVGILLLIVLSELSFRINKKLGVYFEVDPFLINRKLQAEFITVQNIEPGEETEGYFKRLSNKAQRKALIIIYTSLALVLLLVFWTNSVNLYIGVFLVFLPTFISYVSGYISSLISSIGGYYAILRQEKIPGITLEPFNKIYVDGHDSIITANEINEEKLSRLIEGLAETKLINTSLEDLNDIKLYLTEKGVLEDPSNKTRLITSLVKAMFTGIPSYRNLPISTIQEAKTEIKKALREAFLYSIFTTLFVAIVLSIVRSFIDIDNQSFILAIAGFLFPFAFSILREEGAREAQKFLINHWYRRLISKKKETR